MELLQAIKERRSIRKFTPQPVDDALVEDLIKKSLWAPSGMNRQDWMYLVLKGQKLKDFLEQFARKTAEKLDPALQKLFAEKMVNYIKGYFKDLGGAQTVVVCLSKGAEGYVEDHANMCSAAASFYNFLLLAHEAGLGACWMTGYAGVEKELMEFFETPGWKLCGVTPLGYPDQTPPVPPRKHETIVWMR